MRGHTPSWSGLEYASRTIRNALTISMLCVFTLQASKSQGHSIFPIVIASAPCQSRWQTIQRSVIASASWQSRWQTIQRSVIASASWQSRWQTIQRSVIASEGWQSRWQTIQRSVIASASWQSRWQTIQRSVIASEGWQSRYRSTGSRRPQLRRPVTGASRHPRRQQSNAPGQNLDVHRLSALICVTVRLYVKSRP